MPAVYLFLFSKLRINIIYKARPINNISIIVFADACIFIVAAYRKAYAVIKICEITFICAIFIKFIIIIV